MKYISLIDLLMVPIILGAIFLTAYRWQSKKKKENPVYKYYIWGVIMKMAGTIGFCCIYLFYYTDGDTFDYHENALSLMQLLFNDFGHFLDILFDTKPEYLSYFTSEMGSVNSRHFLDPSTYTVSKLSLPFEIICMGSYLSTSFLLSYLSFFGLWKLFLIFTKRHKEISHLLFWGVLAFPSLIFWSGGISKEVFVVTFMCYVIYSIYQIYFNRRRVLIYTFILLIGTYIILVIKPYIFIALVPAIVTWILSKHLLRIRYTFIKLLLFPLVIILTFIGSYNLYNLFSSELGDYGSIEGILEKATITQDDLQHERYQGSSVDIGAYEPTIEGAISKFPEATVLGLFRPFIYEADSIVILFSGLENLLLLLLFVRSVLRPVKAADLIVSDNILLPCMIITIIFAFAIGLSTSNFGALVRFKIPLIPFFTAALLIINFSHTKKEVEE